MKSVVLHDAPADAPWSPYTLPALELRRVLGEARAAGAPFRLTYSVLPGRSGDEAWRRGAAARTVTVDGDGAGGVRCTLHCAKPWGCACAPDEIALQPPRGWWAAHTLVQQAYPLLPEAGDELICFGP